MDVPHVGAHNATHDLTEHQPSGSTITEQLAPQSTRMAHNLPIASRAVPSAAPKPNEYRRQIGVLSTDPKAGHRFASELVRQAGNVTDQQHADAVLLQANDLPPGERGEAAMADIKRGIDVLNRTGAKIAIVTDTAAHAEVSVLRRHLAKFAPDIELIDLPKCALGKLDQAEPGARNVGLIVSPRTFQTNVYQSRAQGGKAFHAHPGSHDALLAAERPDAGKDQIQAGREALRKAVTDMAKRNDIDAIVLGYPGLSDAFGESHVRRADGKMIPVIDSNAAAAGTALEQAKQKRGNDGSDSESDSASCLSGCLGALNLDQVVAPFTRRVSDRLEALERYTPKAGVMGGQGALAGAQFMGELVALGDTRPALVHQATHIADRTSFIKREAGDASMQDAVDPRPEMKKSLDLMERAGVTHAVITCNTAHKFHPDLVDHIAAEGHNIQLLHIAEAALDEIRRQRPDETQVALMATDGTVQSKLYQAHGGNTYQWITPDDEHQRIGMRSIYEGIKRNKIEEGSRDAEVVVDSLIEKYQQMPGNAGRFPVIVLGCTEFPIALPKAVREERWPGVTFVDTLASLAYSLIEKSRVPVPTTTHNVDNAANALRGRVTALEEAQAA
jgi:aspartate racemase